MQKNTGYLFYRTELSNVNPITAPIKIVPCAVLATPEPTSLLVRPTNELLLNAPENVNEPIVLFDVPYTILS